MAVIHVLTQPIIRFRNESQINDNGENMVPENFCYQHRKFRHQVHCGGGGGGRRQSCFAGRGWLLVVTA